jgi:glycogen debranching enzyme
VSGAWTFGGQPALSGLLGVTLVEGSTFCISDPAGDLGGLDPQGLFFRDARILSTWVLTLDGDRLVPMSCQVPEPFAATFVTRARPPAGAADSTLMVVRKRAVGHGMHERITIQNLAQHPTDVALDLRVEADFADLFAVKEARTFGIAPAARSVAGAALRFTADTGEDQPDREVVVAAEPAGTLGPEGFTWSLTLAPREVWSIELTVSPSVGSETLVPRHAIDEPADVGTPISRMQEWRRTSTVVTSHSRRVDLTIARSVEDLGALRIFDPAHPRRAVVAAGAPWFMAVFGRDSLLTAWMILPLDRQLALGTLQTLADRQGAQLVPTTEEQPGRILHEVRFGPQATLWLGGRNVYYGSVDATPLFVMLVGELRRWGTPLVDLTPLLPHVDRALGWITHFGDRDGDGFVEYARLTPQGLEHQGWKDSFDAVTFADGRPARAPIALAEVQGYVYAAYRARAALARDGDDEATARGWDDAAEALRHRFNDTFWLPDKGYYAIGLDHEKRPIDALASNMGHCLWTGIVDEDKAGAVAERLLSPEMFSGWGVRTLATSAAAYNPMSYHNGSVWPHDNAIIAAGLARYGFTEEAARIAEAQFEVAERFDGRLPELFCGFDRSEFEEPIPYPAACSPQAWASAAPFLLLRALLGLEPDAANGVLQLRPAVPARYLPLQVDNVLLDGQRATIRVTEHGADLHGAPEWLELRTAQPHA